MTEGIRNNLMDVGCPEDSAALVEQFYSAGHLDDALRQMRVIRCGLIDELHLSQRRVDCLDYLIRRIEKETKTTTERR
ncbi:MAG: hypothetical protein J5449_07245 [Oscillospiraceae bacterium]|nr:hypothetical protein [Oscillospiraceae bacterium]